MTFLRLFPLRFVLFPGMPYSLQVFEPRYRILVEECLASNEPFGIALIEEGPEVGGSATPHLVGTTAEIDEVLPLGEGRVSLTGHGGRRFRITQLIHDHPYLAAEVDYPVDELSEVPETLTEQVAHQYEQMQRLRHTIQGTWARDIEVPQTAGALADAIGAAAVDLAETAALQTLLETLDVRRRMERASGLIIGMLEVTHGRASRIVAGRWGTVDGTN